MSLIESDNDKDKDDSRSVYAACFVFKERRGSAVVVVRLGMLVGFC